MAGVVRGGGGGMVVGALTSLGAMFGSETVVVLLTGSTEMTVAGGSESTWRGRRGGACAGGAGCGIQVG